MKPLLSTCEHYNRLAAAGDGRHDPPVVQRYMARWDGDRFHELLGEVSGRDVLEVGIGVGRMARDLLQRGCRRLTGLDIAPLAIEAAREELASWPNVELLVGDIVDFRRDAAFDLAYSVLTFMHVEAKQAALDNLVAAVRPGGRIVLSVDLASDWLDYHDYRVPLFPSTPDQYAAALATAGCVEAAAEPIIDDWNPPGGKPSPTFGQPIGALIHGTRG